MSKAPKNQSSIKIPFRLVLIVPFVIQVVLAVGLVGVISFRNGQQAVNNVAYQLRGETTARIKEHLYTFLETPHQINSINTNAIRQGLPKASDLEALEYYLWQQIQVFDSVTSIYFGNIEGGLVDAGREGAEGSLYVIVTDEFKSGPFRKYATDSQGNRTELLTTVPNFDARTRAWYTGAVEKGSATWSDPYILFTGQDMAIAASCPVYDEQQNLLGVVSTDIFVSHISDFIKNLEIGETGSSFIMERSGLLVASSTDENPFTEPDGDKAPRRLYASESAVPTIRYASEFLTEQFGDYINITSEQRQLEFEIDGQRQFLQVSPFQDEYGIDWLLVVVIPESDFMTQINANNRTTALLIGGALIVAVVLGIITAQLITKPISRLNASTQALAQGELNPRISKEWISEIGALANSFNYMVGQLKQTLEGLTSEIAERKRAEEGQHQALAEALQATQALRESEERFRFLAENMADIVWTIDRDFRTTYVSPSIEKVLGFTPEERKLQTLEEMITPDSFQRTNALFLEELQRDGKQDTDLDRYITIEVEYYHADGHIVWMDNNMKALRDETGEFVGVYGSSRNITERKLAEKALRESEAKYRSLIEQSSDAIYLLYENRFEIINASFTKLFGITPEEAISPDFTFLNLVAPHSRPLIEERMRVYAQGLEPDPQYEFTAQDNKGREIEVEVSVTYIPYKDGMAVQGVLRDITERKRMEQQMRRQERLVAIGQLAAGIAHDFRNLLTTIILHAQIGQRLPNLAPGMVKNLEIIITESQKAADLVQQILDFSSRAMIECRPLDLAAFTGIVLEVLRRTIPENVKLALATKPGEHTAPFTVMADPGRIQQVLANLALNARDAMPYGGELRFELSRVKIAAGETPPVTNMEPGDWVCLAVSDTGIGMTEEVRAHLFEPFFTTKEVNKGTGLGLAQVYGIVRQHDGYIDVETEPGKGTTFHIYLPVNEEAIEESETTKPPAPPQGQGETILLVEDNEALRNAGRENLESLGYRVLTAANGHQALEVYKAEGGADLIITDLVMPEMGGEELVRELKSLAPNLKAVGITGYAAGQIMEKLREAGFLDIIHKPFGMEVLAQVVRRTLDVH